MTELQPNVTELRLSREFEFSAGDYVLINIPRISLLEWHPFTISSPPEYELFSLHVKNSGGWSEALYRLATRSQLGATPQFGNNKIKPAVDNFIEGPSSVVSPALDWSLQEEG